MTTYQINSIRSAIADCDRFISKETARGAYNRPADVAKLLEWYVAHRAKLAAMIEAA